MLLFFKPNTSQSNSYFFGLVSSSIQYIPSHGTEVICHLLNCVWRDFFFVLQNNNLYKFDIFNTNSFGFDNEINWIHLGSIGDVWCKWKPEILGNNDKLLFECDFTNIKSKKIIFYLNNNKCSPNTINKKQYYTIKLSNNSKHKMWYPAIRLIDKDSWVKVTFPKYIGV